MLARLRHWAESPCSTSAPFNRVREHPTYLRQPNLDRLLVPATICTLASGAAAHNSDVIFCQPARGGCSMPRRASESTRAALTSTSIHRSKLIHGRAAQSNGLSVGFSFGPTYSLARSSSEYRTQILTQASRRSAKAAANI